MRFSKSFAPAIALAIAAACGKESGFIEPPPTEVITVNIISPANGQAIEQSAWPDSPVEIRVSATSSLRGTVSNPEVKLDGNVVGNASVVSVNVTVGAHTIEVCAKGTVNPNARGCATATFTINAAPPIVVEIFPPSLASPWACSDFRAFAEKAAVRDFAGFTDNGGICRASIVSSLIFEDSVWVGHDVINQSSRKFYGQTRLVRKSELRSPTRCVCVGNRFTVPDGRWAGSSFPLLLTDEAFALGRDGLSLFIRSTGDPIVYTIGAWRRSKWPVAVAFRRESGASIPPDYLAEATGFVQELSDELGVQLQVVQAPAQPDNKWPGILVTVSDTATQSRGGAHYRSANGEILAGSVILAKIEFLQDRFVVKHEILHALGLGHTPAYSPSLMQEFQEWTPLFGMAVAKDALYLRADYEILEMQWQVGAQCGIREAHVWELMSRNIAPGPVQWSP